MNKKCLWALNSPLEENYHDKEWGIPLFDEQRLFEMLILEGHQAGLSWSTILKRREGLRKAYHNFDPLILSKLTEKDIERYMTDDRVIKNRLKIVSVVKNAKAYLELIKTEVSLKDYLWQHVSYMPIINRFKTVDEIPQKTDLSIKISKDLKKRGFNFVGPTIIYAYMQAIGMTNDHLITCPSYQIK